MYASKNLYGYLAIFPLLNIFDGAMLLILLRANAFDENPISEENSEIRATVLGSSAEVIVFLVYQYVFKLYLATTFSLCVAFATNFNRLIVKIFFLKKAAEIGLNRVV